MSSHSERYMCQVNYAVRVKINAPQLFFGSCCSVPYSAQLSGYFSSFQRNALDCFMLVGIFYLTGLRFSDGEIYAEIQAYRYQTPGARAACLAQSTLAYGDRSALPRKQLLRPTRSGSGQIRDATPGACRGTVGAPSLFRLRFLSPLLLSSPSGLRAGRAARANPPQARPASRPQTDWRCSGLSPQGKKRATRAWRLSLGSAPRSRVWSEASSAHHRARVRAAAKKSSLTEAALERPEFGNLTQHYERIRESALNQRQREDQGLGLALFLRAGMTAWMQTYAQISQPLPSVVPVSCACEQTLDARLQRDLINILVAIVLDPKKEKQR